MIPINLQDALVEEFKTLFQGIQFKNANNQLCGLNIYPQALPAKKHANDDDHMPYLIVRLQEGEDPGHEHTCKIRLIIGIYNDSEDYQGYRDVMMIIQKIYNFLMAKRVIAQKYELQYPINWSLTDDDFYPFFFGGMETNWRIGQVNMPDDDLI